MRRRPLDSAIISYVVIFLCWFGKSTPSLHTFVGANMGGGGSPLELRAGVGAEEHEGGERPLWAVLLLLLGLLFLPLLGLLLLVFVHLVGVARGLK